MTTQGLPGDRNHHPLDCGGKCGMGHDQQPEEPKYTESDMRVLTEAALRLGRKDAAEELAEVCLGQRIAYDEGSLDDFTKGWNGCAVNLSEMARDIGKGDPT